ncbi:MAG: tetratricopeptide repeat protein, partial [bacterium]
MADPRGAEIAKLEALFAANPNGRVFAHLAEAYRRAGELERARALLEAGLERHADYASAHVVHGRVLLDLGREAEAEAAFRRVLGLDPENLVALRALGDLARRAGRAAEALGYYEQLQSRDPSSEELEAIIAELRAVVAAQPAGGGEWGPAVGGGDAEPAAGFASGFDGAWSDVAGGAEASVEGSAASAAEAADRSEEPAASGFEVTAASEPEEPDVFGVEPATEPGDWAAAAEDSGPSAVPEAGALADPADAAPVALDAEFSVPPESVEAAPLGAEERALEVWADEGGAVSAEEGAPSDDLSPAPDAAAAALSRGETGPDGVASELAAPVEAAPEPAAEDVVAGPAAPPAWQAQEPEEVGGPVGEGPATEGGTVGAEAPEAV